MTENITLLCRFPTFDKNNIFNTPCANVRFISASGIPKSKHFPVATGAGVVLLVFAQANLLYMPILLSPDAENIVKLLLSSVKEDYFIPVFVYVNFHKLPLYVKPFCWLLVRAMFQWKFLLTLSPLYIWLPPFWGLFPV